MLADRVVCPSCGRETIRKKRCMYCFAPLPEEEQGRMGGRSLPYWMRRGQGEVSENP